MASHSDETEFVDSDFQAAQKSQPATLASRPPTREELDAQVGGTQQKLAELKRAQEELERERATLEEARRRQAEFQTGREEMAHHLTRGIALLAEAEFAARRDAEQMARTLEGLNDALTKLQAIQDSAWTQENWSLELTRALTTIENARMEWNSARLKWPVLNSAPVNGDVDAASPNPPAAASPLTGLTFPQLCKAGLAFTWPLVLLGLAIFLVLLLRR